MESDGLLCSAHRHRPKQPMRKELEPSRRLSETTGPQSPSAFRIAFRVTEVTERAARCKHEAPRFTHRAPKARRYRPALERLHTLPRIVESRFTCYRSLSGVVQCPCAKRFTVPVHMLPRTHLTVMFPLPLRTLRTVVYRAVREWSLTG